MSEPVIVRMQDVRAMKGCAKGARDFCQLHGISWADFLENGIDAAVLDATGDAMALRLTATARKRLEAERG